MLRFQFAFLQASGLIPVVLSVHKVLQSIIFFPFIEQFIGTIIETTYKFLLCSKCFVGKVRNIVENLLVDVEKDANDALLLRRVI